MSRRARQAATLLTTAAVLAVSVAAVYAPVTGYGFFDVDDEEYVVANPWVRGGLTSRGVAWAFRSASYAGNWHPLTWLSLMLDAGLFGVRPGAFHAVNVCLHLAGAFLLFLALRAMTGTAAVAAGAALLFAAHPLHVESVVWIAERKDVLAGACLMLVLLSYVAYLRRPGMTRYAVLAATSCLGLMAKPTLVMIPAVLLVLDFWPLGRFKESNRSSACRLTLERGGGSAFRPLLEKVPLLIPAAAVALLTYHAQSVAGLVLKKAGAGGFRSWSVANALVSVAGYLRRAVWPAGLAFHYPLPGGGWGAERVVPAALLALLATTVLFLLRRERPFLLSGWLWFLAFLLPALGLIQVGTQAMADRYAYLPLIGLYLAVCRFLLGGAGRAPRRLLLSVAILAAALVLLMAAARAQVGYWRDSRTVYERSLSVTRGNWLVNHRLGMLLAKEGRLEEAAARQRQALAVHPGLWAAYEALGDILLRQGRGEEALDEYRRALAVSPDPGDARERLAGALARLGKTVAAEVAYREVVRLDPGRPEAWHNLGLLLAGQGRLAEAEGAYREAIRLDGEDADSENGLGAVLARQGRTAEAADHFRRALKVNPRHAEAGDNLRQALRQMGKGKAPPR